MATSLVNLSTTEYVKANSMQRAIRLQSLRDSVHVVFDDVKPDVDHDAFHTLSSADEDMVVESIDTDIWVLARTDTSALAITETPSIPAFNTTKWLDPYTPGQEVGPYTVVESGGWLMVSNKETDDPATPVVVGEPTFIYDGDSPTSAVNTKQIIAGNRYAWGLNGWLSGYRVNVVTGNRYIVYSVKDPLGVPIVNQVSDFVADKTGWVDLAIDTVLVTTGTLFDLVVVVNEPDPTPTIWTGDWNYQKPNNVTPPSTGQVTHANKQLDLILIHKFDNGGADRSAELLALDTGDVWQIADGTRWAIQNITDSGSYVTMSVAPSLQDPLTGVQTFTAETVVATPFTRMEDIDYWSNNPLPNGTVQGLYIEDGEYEDIVPNNSAYGVDILVQEALFSEDWDFMSYTGSVGSGGNAVDIRTSTVLIAESFITQQPVATDTPIQLSFGPAQVTEEVDIDAAGVVTFKTDDEYKIGLRLQFGRTGNPGSAIIFGRAVFNGVQISSSVFAELDDSQDVIPTNFAGDIAVVPGDTLTVEIYRDSAGVNQGGVFTKVATIPEWTDAPSCRITIDKVEAVVL